MTPNTIRFDDYLTIMKFFRWNYIPFSEEMFWFGPLLDCFSFTPEMADFLKDKKYRLNDKTRFYYKISTDVTRGKSRRSHNVVFIEGSYLEFKFKKAADLIAFKMTFL